jgi:hypothetical protein
MQVIPPATIGDSQLTSSTVPEVVAATYSAGTTYAIGARVGLAPVDGVAQTVWESKQNGNLGNTLVEGAWWTNVGIVYPVWNSGHNYAIGNIVTDLATHRLYRGISATNSNKPVTDTTHWELIGATNRWRMFDYTRSIQTEKPGSITVVVAPGVRCDSFAVTGLGGSSYSLTVTSVLGGGTIYSASGTLNTRTTTTWYEYFFGAFAQKESLAIFDIPPYTDSVFTFTVTASTGTAYCGALILGRFIYIGATQYNAVADTLNFSTVARDLNGNAVLTQRRNIPTTTQTIWAEKTAVNKIRAVRDELNATPAFWYGVADDDDGYFESLAVLGVYKEFVINVALPEKAIVNIKVEKI